jgi:hypothetical protein
VLIGKAITVLSVIITTGVIIDSKFIGNKARSTVKIISILIVAVDMLYVYFKCEQCNNTH